MKRQKRDADDVGAILLIGSVIAAACVAGITPIVDSRALNLISAGTTAVASDGRICNSCGVVEQVRELEPAVSRHEFSTVAGGGIEGIAVILGALGGKFRLDRSPIYEVAVRMRDGSVRVLRTAMPPACKSGDRVRVVMGRVAPA